MDRRELLSRLGLLVGGTIIGAEAFLMGCSPVDKSTGPILIQSQMDLLNEIGEIIIPTTPDSEGAKAANVGKFMNTIVTEFYNGDERKVFIEGLKKLEQSSFLSLNESERVSFVMNLENLASEQPEDNYYLMIKQLTIWGYLTSEVGMTQLYDFAPVPGYYDGSVDYKAGDKVMNPRITNWQSRNFAEFHSKS